MLIIRELLENQVSISDLAEKHSVTIQDIYRWKKQLFESTEIFDRKTRSKESPLEKKSKELKDKIQQKDSVISELVEENIELRKKYNGLS
jgi:transposase-like protein